ncbi:hypothetical protein NTG1052_360013 [Candidatus Nitrotoga sp. 1052]|nr:hypothetical protein NTG1052_360013 [Candidatus Nitrotoga sp. 1052]
MSLFTHNRLGRLMLPAIYYLGGVPLTQPMGKYSGPRFPDSELRW